MFAYFVLILCVSSLSRRGNANDAPLEYTDEDFSSKIADHQTALVMFYAPWCGHCKKLKPEFDTAAQQLAINDPPVALIKVDCTSAGKKTCDAHEVGGFPSLRIFRNGKSGPTYSGPRNAAEIVEYMKLRAGLSYKEFIDPIRLEEYLDEETGVVLLGLFDGDSEMKTAFTESADRLRDKVKFASSSSKDVLEKYEASYDDIWLIRPVHLRNKFEDFRVKFSGNASFEEINEFVSKNYHGLVGLRDEKNRDDFKPPLVIGYFDVDYNKNIKNTNYWRNRFLKVARTYAGKLMFGMSHFRDLLEFGDIEYKNSPIVFAKNDEGEKFKMDGDFSVEALENFTRNFLDDNLEPYVKSEAIPENDDDLVKTVVARNFEDAVIENGKDTLIAFHSPWCGHCQGMMPTYANVAEALMDEDVVIAKMDGTRNDVPEAYKLDGYPTIYWAAKNAKNKPIPYNGDRSFKDFISFVAKHSTEELEGYDRNGKSKKKDEL